MLQLSSQYITSQLFNAFSYLYVFSGYFFEWLLFYPLGIVLASYVLIAIYYMVLSTSKSFSYYIKSLLYNLVDLLFVLDLFTSCGKYLLGFYRAFYLPLFDLTKIYSIYMFVFFLKRVEFYLFWVFVILLYC